LIVLAVLFSGWNISWAGSIVSARCEACGYDSGRLFLFGGRSNFKTVCNFPGYCPDKKVLVLVNLMAENSDARACPGQELIPYNAPEMIRNPGSKTVASWNLPDPWKKQVKLTDGDYFCPNCKTFHLHFHPSGYWD
jgi:hypothetical protein